MRIAVIAARGLGDGLISMVLTHNLCRAGHSVTCFSSVLCHLRQWFPDKTIQPFPSSTDFYSTFSQFDRLIVADHACVNEHHHFGNECIILKEKEFNRKLTMVENLKIVCSQRLGLKDVTSDNGIQAPPSLIHGRFPQRIILHPMSTCPKKNWPAERYLDLYKKLQDVSYEPVLCVSPEERLDWKNIIKTDLYLLPVFPSLHDLACYIYESKAMIGNDSGVGHLASCLKIPTLSLFARRSHAALWRPGWGYGQILTAPAFLIGAPLQQKLWKTTLSSRSVTNTFLKMMQEIKHHKISS
ncbi:MAG: hypothetical protein JSS62_03720 [Verrucomicrobia bacterium]|nr:hypothetical protein [Verrucomicrobiota bacterium]MBS0645106.1 hypothetical protein [Verrucomicrobiota bacterium]